MNNFFKNLIKYVLSFTVCIFLLGIFGIIKGMSGLGEAGFILNTIYIVGCAYVLIFVWKKIINY